MLRAQLPLCRKLRECCLAAPASASAVLEAARKLRAVEQARQQRGADATQALTAEGLGQYAGIRLPGWLEWVRSGSGSLEALLDAARTQQQAQEARAARRAHLEQLLAAEGLQEHAHGQAFAQYVHSGEGSEEAVLEAARAAAATAAARAQRRATLEAALAGEGIPYISVRFLEAVENFIYTDAASLETGVRLVGPGAGNSRWPLPRRQEELLARCCCAGACCRCCS